MLGKTDKLLLLADSVARCTRCPELVCGRLKTVFGEGNDNAELMIIGEAPGKTEAERGVPFCGPAGELLDNIIKAAGWNRKDLYICNCITCKPPNNRNPSTEELNNCRWYLDKQIEVVDPYILLLLGSVSSNNLLGMSVSEARGRWHEYRGRTVRCSFHPAFLLRQEGQQSVYYKRQVWEDVKAVVEKLRLKRNP